MADAPLPYSDNTALYDQDLAQWGTQTAALLRAGELERVDLEAVAEELDSLGSSVPVCAGSVLKDLLVWFLAWNYAPDQRPAHPHWYVRIGNQRIVLDVLLGCSPSLRPRVVQELADAYARAREVAGEETGLPLEAFPETCPWPVQQVVRQGFWPMGCEEQETRPVGLDVDPQAWNEEEA
jgi:hypothetical protein